MKVKKLISLFLVMVISTALFAQGFVEIGATNLDTATLAIDGDFSTYWQGVIQAEVSKLSLEVDLGSAKSIDKLLLAAPQAFQATFQFKYQNPTDNLWYPVPFPGTTDDSVTATIGNSSSPYILDLATIITTNKIAVTFLNQNGEILTVRISEFQSFNNINNNPSYTASSNADAIYGGTPASFIDGNFNTNFIAGKTAGDNISFTVDYNGQINTIDKLYITAGESTWAFGCDIMFTYLDAADDTWKVASPRETVSTYSHTVLLSTPIQAKMISLTQYKTNGVLEARAVSEFQAFNTQENLNLGASVVIVDEDSNQDTATLATDGSFDTYWQGVIKANVSKMSLEANLGGTAKKIDKLILAAPQAFQATFQFKYQNPTDNLWYPVPFPGTTDDRVTATIGNSSSPYILDLASSIITNKIAVTFLNQNGETLTVRISEFQSFNNINNNQSYTASSNADAIYGGTPANFIDGNLNTNFIAGKTAGDNISFTVDYNGQINTIDKLYITAGESTWAFGCDIMFTYLDAADDTWKVASPRETVSTYSHTVLLSTPIQAKMISLTQYKTNGVLEARAVSEFQAFNTQENLNRNTQILVSNDAFYYNLESYIIKNIKTIQNVIANMPRNTTVSTFISSINKADTVNVSIKKSLNGIDLTGNDNIGTGAVVFINSNNNPIELKVCIKGDMDGSGNIDLIDLTKLKKHLIKSELLEDLYLEAGDLSGKGSVTISDLIKIKKHLLGISLINESGDLEDVIVNNIFNVDSYGAVPDGVTNSRIAIQAAINAAKSSNAPSIIQFSDGIYLVDQELNINKSEGVDFTMVVNGINNCIIQGAADSTTTIVIKNPALGGFKISDCEGIVLKDITIDYGTLPYTQGTIYSKDLTAGTITLDLDFGYPDFNNQCFSPDVYYATYGVPITMDSNKDLSEFGPEVIYSSSFSHINGNRWVINVEQNSLQKISELEIGSKYIQVARRSICSPIYAIKNTSIGIQDITIYSAPAAATLFGMNNGVAINGLNVTIKPLSNRLISTNADGIHSYGNRGGMQIENCTFYAMGDDAINLHSKAGYLTQIISTTQVKVYSGNDFYEVGDVIQVMDSLNNVLRDTVTITAVTTLSDTEYILTFNKAVNGMVVNSNRNLTDTIYNTSACGQNSIIQNNTFYSHRGRHILLGSHDVIIRENDFRIGYGVWTAVSLEFSPDWHEGPAPYNININNNIFTGTGTPRSNTAIHFNPGTYASGAIGRTIKNITIDRNKFNNMFNTCLAIIGGEDVFIRNNEINVSTSRIIGSTINILNSSGVEIDGLTGTDSNNNTVTTSVIYIDSRVVTGTAGVNLSNINYTLTATTTPPLTIDLR